MLVIELKFDVFSVKKLTVFLSDKHSYNCFTSEGVVYFKHSGKVFTTEESVVSQTKKNLDIHII